MIVDCDTGINPKTNPGLKKIEDKIDAMTRKTNTSYVARENLKQSQIRHGVPAARTRSMVTSGATRWSGMQSKFRRSNCLAVCLNETFGNESALEVAYLDQDLTKLDAELDALSDDGFSDTSSLDALEDAMSDDTKLSTKFTSRDARRRDDQIGDLAEAGSPCDLLLTPEEWTTLREMEGLLDFPEDATTLLEGHKKASGEIRRALVEPHKALIAIRKVMKIIGGNYVAEYKACAPTDSAETRRKNRIPKQFNRCSDVAPSADIKNSSFILP